MVSHRLFVALLFSLLSALAQACPPSESEDCAYTIAAEDEAIIAAGLTSDRIERRNAEFIVGLHLGTTYTQVTPMHRRTTQTNIRFFTLCRSSVALFKNGTYVNLARVEGDAAYRAAMQSYVSDVPVWGANTTSYGSQLSDRTARYNESSYTSTLSRLKDASEDILGAPLRYVHIATPAVETSKGWMPTADATLVHALLDMGLELPLWDTESLENVAQFYTNEASAVLAANKRLVCSPCSCVPHVPCKSPTAHVYYVSLTNSSLFISSQEEACLYRSKAANMTTAPEYGLDNLPDQGAHTFWNGMRDYILSTISQDRQRYCQCAPAVLLVAGDETTNPDYLAMLHSARKAIPQTCFTPSKECNQAFNSKRYQHEKTGQHKRIPYSYQDPTREAAELLVAKDPVFDAARGAAVALEAKFWNTCNECAVMVALGECMWNYPGNADTDWSCFPQLFDPDGYDELDENYWDQPDDEFELMDDEFVDQDDDE